MQIDLRATKVNGVPIAGAQTQHFIPFVHTGDVISFDVFAIITGHDANLNNDRIVAAAGGFVTSPIGLKGNLNADIVRTIYDPETGDPTVIGFDQVGSSVGFHQDLDEDGDIDVGSFDHEHDPKWWAVRYGAAPQGAPAAPPTGRQVGLGTFTVTSSGPGSTLIQFIGRQWWTGAQYIEDGVLIGVSADDSLPEHSIAVSTIPEPGSVGTVAATVGLLLGGCRRRRQ
jgi:hypothetical protein